MNLDLDKISTRIHYQFKNAKLLDEAMTHKSFCVDANENCPYNERFEYLGDAIVNLIIAEKLFLDFPQDQEGMLSKKRASLVNQEALAALAKKCELQNYIIMGPGERKQESHLKPRILASTFEAVIGAIYLDSNFEIVKKWILQHFKEMNFNIDVESGYQQDYKTRLQELTQKEKMGTPTYELVLTSGPSHKPIFLVCLKLNGLEKMRAEGTSKKNAEQMAAQLFLSELEKSNYEKNSSEKLDTKIKGAK